MSNEFPFTGSELLRKPFNLLALVLFAIACAVMIAWQGFMAGMVFLLIPVAIFILVGVFRDPRFGLYFTFAFSFIAIGISRYMAADIPFGLGIDVLLILVWVALILTQGRKLSWKKAGNGLTWVSVIWMAYTVLELANPQAVSFQAWFYAMRGVAFYQILVVVAGLLIVKDKKDLRLFLIIWFGFSVFAAIKGIQQITIGPDHWENAWLDSGGALTHRIQGRLRAFSIYSDAGQFGAAMGHVALVTAIMALGPGPGKRRLILVGISLITITGMLYSGTRGALFVPVAGVLLYLFLKKNFKVFVLGMLLIACVYAGLRYTSVGNSNYQIYRLRTAVQPTKDPSFLVRRENQQKLKVYLADKPFGGGVGSAGNWGMRFSPNTFLAQTPTDSWYVRIWAEMGIVGLILHLAILFYILIRCCGIVGRLTHPIIRQIMIGLTCGIFGVMVASYGNGIYGQMPTGMIIYLSYVFIYISPTIEKSLSLRPGISK